MARAKITAVDKSGAEPLYEVTLEDGAKRGGLKVADLKTASPAAAPSGDVPFPDPALKQLADAPDIYAYDLTAGLITVNEYRERKGFPRVERFGDKLIVEFVAENAETFARAACALAGRPFASSAAEPPIAVPVPPDDAPPTADTAKAEDPTP